MKNLDNDLINTLCSLLQETLGNILEFRAFVQREMGESFDLHVGANDTFVNMQSTYIHYLNKKGTLHRFLAALFREYVQNDDVSAFKARYEAFMNDNTAPLQSQEGPHRPFNDTPSTKFALLYHPDDAPHAEQLRTHLGLLVRQKLIEVFDVHQKNPYADNKELARAAAAAADYVLLLVTPSILKDDMVWLDIATEALQQGNKPIPVRVEKVSLSGERLNGITGFPAQRRFISEYSNRDLAYSEISEAIRRQLLGRK